MEKFRPRNWTFLEVRSLVGHLCPGSTICVAGDLVGALDLSHIPSMACDPWHVSKLELFIENMTNLRTKQVAGA